MERKMTPKFYSDKFRCKLCRMKSEVRRRVISARTMVMTKCKGCRQACWVMAGKP